MNKHAREKFRKGTWTMSFRLLYLMAFLLLLGALPADLLALGARPRAMGGAFMGVSDDENAVWTNPAGMSQIDRGLGQVTAQVVAREKYYSDSLAYVGKMFQAGGSKKVTLEDYLESDYEFKSEPERVSNYSYGVGYSRTRMSPELNEQLGRQYISEDQQQLVLGFATRFPIAERLTRRPELYGGLSLEFNSHDWRNPSLGGESISQRDVWELNLSMFYRANKRLNVGMRMDSVLSATTADKPTSQEANSFTFNTGAGYTFGEKRDTVVALDLVNVFNASRAQGPQLRIGLERQFLDNDLALRIGSYEGTLTLGFGLKFFGDFKMDYAYENFTTMREHYVSVRVPF